LGVRLRISPELWAKEDDPTLHMYLQRSMTGTCSMIIQPKRSYDQRSGVWREGPAQLIVRGDGYKLLLEVPNVQDRKWDFDIVDFGRVDKRDRSDLLQGRELAEEVIILSPEQLAFETENGFEMGSVPVEVGFAINAPEFNRLAWHLKSPINWAWHKLKRGRLVRRVFDHDGWVLFFLWLDPNHLDRLRETSTGEDVLVMQDALAEAGVGRIVTDNYELQRLREMTEKFGEALPA
jgi:hypothetical protein